MGRSRSLLALLALALAVTAFAAPAARADWLTPLDEGFGVHGRSLPDPAREGQMESIKMLPDGRMLVVGKWTAGANSDDWFVARFLPSGALDASFGANGYARFGGRWINDIAVAPNGSIAVATESDLWYLGPNGTRDKAFNGNGVIGGDRLPFKVTFAQVAFDDSGRLLVSGRPTAGDEIATAIQRLSAKGKPDSTFGTGGLATVPGSPVNFTVDDLELAEDGSMLLLAFANIVRFDARGVRDMSFGDAGTLSAPKQIFFQGSRFSSLAVQPNGEFAGAIEDVSVGRTTVNYFYRTAIYDRLGHVLKHADGERRIRVLPGGGYVATGTRDPAAAVPWAVTLIDSPGSPSPLKFGGTYVFGYGGTGAPVDVAPTSDGDVVLAGQACLRACRAALAKPVLRSDKPGALAAWIVEPDSYWSLSKVLSISGYAYPRSRVARVELAILKTDAKLLKRGKCRWMKTDFRRYAVKRSGADGCSSPHWIKASGTGSWRVDRARSLPPGAYTAYVRVFGTDGTVTPFDTGLGTQKTFSVSRPKRR